MRLVIAGIALILVLLTGALSWAAFSDAAVRCPGNQCADARRAGTIYAGIAGAGLLVLALTGLEWRLRRS